MFAFPSFFPHLPPLTTARMSTPDISLPRSLRTRSNAATTTPAPPRRTSAQVKQDKALKKAQQRNESEQSQVSLAAAAQYEHDTLSRQRAEDEMASNPVIAETPAKRVKRLRPDDSVEPHGLYSMSSDVFVLTTA